MSPAEDKTKKLQLDRQGLHLKSTVKTIFTIPWDDVRSLEVEEVENSPQAVLARANLARESITKGE